MNTTILFQLSGQINNSFSMFFIWMANPRIWPINVEPQNVKQ